MVAPFPSLAHFLRDLATPQLQTANGSGSTEKWRSPPLPMPTARAGRGCASGLRSPPFAPPLPLVVPSLTMGPPPRHFAPSRALPPRLLPTLRSCSTTANGPARFQKVSQPPLPQTRTPAHLISGRAAGLRSVPALAGRPPLHSAGLCLPAYC